MTAIEDLTHGFCYKQTTRDFDKAAGTGSAAEMKRRESWRYLGSRVAIAYRERVASADTLTCFRRASQCRGPSFTAGGGRVDRSAPAPAAGLAPEVCFIAVNYLRIMLVKM